MYDFENICRTCLSKEDLKPLYEKCSRSICLIEMLMTCTFVKFAEDDGLPANICTNCIQEIDQAFSFAKRCETTDAILRNCVKIKTESASNSSQSEKVEPIIEAKAEIEIKPEIILPNLHRTVEEVVEDYEFVEIKQEDVKIEDDEYVEEVKQEENAKMEYVKVKQEEELIIANKYNKTCDDPADEIKHSNSQIEEESTKGEKESDLYDCKKCFEKFPNFEGLKKHREESKHPPGRSSCPICNKMIVYGSLKQHIRTHTAEKPYRCEICGASYKQRSNLSQHKRIRHAELNDPTYHCKICNKMIAGKLKQHMSTHTGEKLYCCEICGASFNQAVYLNKHKLALHSGTNDRIYKCQTCAKSFKRLDLLRAHQKREKRGLKRNRGPGIQVIANAPTSCPVCKKIMRYDAMKRHMRTHTGERPYSCDICGTNFIDTGHLSRHKRALHSEPNDDRLYQCQTCDKSFKRLDLLKLHQRREKKVKSTILAKLPSQILRKDFQCPLCDKAFTTKTLLGRHSLNHGEKKFFCSVCGRGFFNKDILNSHSKVHMAVRQYVCQVCGKEFSKLQHLKSHKIIHTTEKQNFCSVCNKTFTNRTNIKRHMRTHTGEKPYSCEICCKNFTAKSSLIVHKRSHTGEMPYSCSVCEKRFNSTSNMKKHKRSHGEQNLLPAS